MNAELERTKAPAENRPPTDPAGIAKTTVKYQSSDHNYWRAAPRIIQAFGLAIVCHFALSEPDL